MHGVESLLSNLIDAEPGFLLTDEGRCWGAYDRLSECSPPILPTCRVCLVQVQTESGSIYG